jgi:MFS transporter, OFA family, oxalate/formate antiporter
MNEDRRDGSRYGWVVVGASVLLNAGFLGTPVTFGVFMKALQGEFGWSFAAVSGAMSVMMAVSGVVGIIAGKITDKYGMSIVLSVGMLAGVASFLLLSLTQSLWHFYLEFGLGVGICTGCAYSPITAAISKWFVRRRAQAIGIALTGIIIGQMVLPPIVERVISSDGWRTAFFVLAMITLACGLPGVILVSRKPKVLGAESTLERGGSVGREGPVLDGYTVIAAAKTAPFWMLMITGFAVSAGYYILVSHITTRGLDVGLSDRAASLIVAISAIGSLTGTLLAGWLTTRLGGKRALLMLCLGQVVAMMLFIATRSAWSFYLVAVVYGIFFGASTPVRLAMVAPLFGLRSVGTLLGLAVFAWACGGIFSPYVAGFIRDTTGSYNGALIMTSVLLLAAAGSVALWGAHKEPKDVAPAPIANE